MGDTCEQLFHALRSFTFNENTEAIDSYVIRIRQVATLLGYWEPQILEVFKNTLPTKLYWMLFPIEDLRQAVEMAKRILTKENLDKQLTGQTSTSPFMSVGDKTDRRVSFNTREELGDEIDKLTVIMSKLAAKDNHEGRPFKQQIYKSRGQNRSYGQIGNQTRSDSGNRGHITNNNSRVKYRSNNFRGTARGYVDKIIEKISGMKGIVVTVETGVGQGKELLQGIMVITEIEAQATIDLDQDLELVQIGIG